MRGRTTPLIESNALDPEAHGPGRYLCLGDFAYLLAHQGGAYRGFQRNLAGLEIHLVGAYYLESHACVGREVRKLDPAQKADPVKLLDLVAPSVALGQSIGRWGNYFNSEAHGGPTDLPWGIMVDGVKVHPTFLYESIWCFLLFIFLTLLCKKRNFSGQIALLYGMLYSAERFFVEALRTDSLMIGPFKQAQVLSLCVIIACAVIYYILNKRATQHSPSTLS